MISTLIVRSGTVLSTVLFSMTSLLIARPTLVRAATSMDFTPQRHCTVDTVPTTTFNGGNLATTVNNLPSNSTLMIQPAPNNGEYVVSVEMAIINKQNVTICGAPGTHPKIKQTSNAWRIFTVGNSNNITIEGLEIYSINDSAHDQVSGVQAIEGAHHVNVWDMWVHDVPACGVCSARSMGHNDFRYNRIWNTASYSRYQQSGISLFNNRNGGGGDDTNGYSDYLIGNMIWNSKNLSGRGTDGNCIILDYNKNVQKIPAYTGHFLVANNLCVANGGRGIHMNNSDNADIVNNTLYHDLKEAQAHGGGLDQHQGEISVYNSSNLRIVNNLSIAAGYGNVYDSGSTGTNVVLVSNMFNGKTSRQPLNGGFTMIGDPKLHSPNESPLLGDFRPNDGSAVLNAGVAAYQNVYIPTVDFNGTPRDVSRPSVGAFEKYQP